MPWVHRLLRGQRVFAKVTDDGELAAESGRVAVVYRLSGDAKIYRASAANLRPIAGDDEIFEADIDTSAPTATPAKVANKSAKPAAGATTLPSDALIVYTDGACTGNPGPAGVGIVILDDGERTEISEYLGEATNNIAELTAILRALENVDPKRVVAIHTDSSYAIGLLSKGWKAKANQELVAKIRRVAAAFPKLQFVKVKGHSGIPENERADELARLAVESQLI